MSHVEALARCHLKDGVSLPVSTRGTFIRCYWPAWAITVKYYLQTVPVWLEGWRQTSKQTNLRICQTNRQTLEFVRFEKNKGCKMPCRLIKLPTCKNQSLLMCFHQHLDFFLCVLCCVMFGQGDNVFCFVAADAYGVHMRIAFNFWGNVLNRRWAVGNSSA